MFLLVAGAAFGQNNTINVILRGVVVMDDGTPLTKSVGIQKLCTDGQGSAPGPITNKDGTFIWRMDLAFLATKRCFLESTAAGFVSSQVEISTINPTNANIDLPPIKLSLKGGDPYLAGNNSGGQIPGKAKADWEAAMKAAGAGDSAGAIQKLESAVAGSPNFAMGWHNLGIFYTYAGDSAKARSAFEKAIETDPKLLQPHIVLTRLMIKEKNWDGALKMAATALPLDKEKLYPELYLHQAVAEYHLKDLAMAEAHAKQALDPKNKRPVARAEYVMGRILEAKGDTAGAKQHMSKYLEMVPTADDFLVIKDHIDHMGQADAPEPDLEVITR
jgi:tetratricopeptide (TPR) repeat protein